MPSHKTLRSVVRGLADSFTSLMNYREDDYVLGHVVYAAWVTGSTGFRADLLTGETDSSPLLVPQVRAAIRDLVRQFPDVVRRSKSSPEFVTQAELVVGVDPNTRRPHDGSKLFESPYTLTVRIVDERGKVYEHRVEDWWYPEHPPRERQPWWRFWRA